MNEEMKARNTLLQAHRDLVLKPSFIVPSLPTSELYRYLFSWTVSSDDDSDISWAISQTHPVLWMSPLSLASNRRYTFRLDVTAIPPKGATPLHVSAIGRVTILDSPPLARIEGGNYVYTEVKDPLKVEVAAWDPDGMDGPLAYRWRCRLQNFSSCDSLLPPNASNAKVLEIPKGTLVIEGNYWFEVTVAKASGVSTTESALVVVRAAKAGMGSQYKVRVTMVSPRPVMRSASLRLTGEIQQGADSSVRNTSMVCASHLSKWLRCVIIACVEYT